MKYLLIVSVCILVLVLLYQKKARSHSILSTGDQVTSKDSVNSVSVDQLNKAIESGDDILILDVRTAQEVSEGHLPDAINIDVMDSTFATKTQNLDMSATIYVYCKSGVRSKRASKQLINMGFTDIRNVLGGYVALEKSGAEIVR